MKVTLGKFLTCLLLSSACVPSSAMATITFPATLTVENNATGDQGSTLLLGDVDATDTLSFSVTGTSFLQGAGIYGVNAAGVTTVIGLFGFGTGFSLSDYSSGFTYGALIATLNGNISRQVFGTNTANGVGQSNAPTTLSYSNSLAGLFGVSGALTAATLNFHVDDTGYLDNSGSFLITSGAPVDTTAANAAVPEPATWAMMMLGFGAVGYAMRRRGKFSPDNNFV